MNVYVNRGSPGSFYIDVSFFEGGVRLWCYAEGTGHKCFDGYLQPGRVWRRTSIAQAVERAMRWIHRREIERELAQAEVTAARETLRAVAELERSLRSA